jgi:predicted nucleic acid-binding protein
MPKIVADASAVLAVLLGERHRSAVMDAATDADLLAPPSLAWEVGNAVVAMTRRGRFTGTQAAVAIVRFEAIPVRTGDVPLGDAVALAVGEGIYAYDAYNLWLAEHHGAPLLSLDLRLRAVARRRGLALLPEHVEGDERHV